MGTLPLHATRPPETSHCLLDRPTSLYLAVKGLNVHPETFWFELRPSPNHLGRSTQPCDSKAVALQKFPH